MAAKSLCGLFGEDRVDVAIRAPFESCDLDESGQDLEPPMECGWIVSIQRCGLQDIVISRPGVFDFDRLEGVLYQAGEFCKLFWGAFFEGGLMAFREDRNAVGKPGCKWAEGDKRFGLGDDALGGLKFFFQDIAKIASAVGLEIFQRSALGFEYIAW